MSSSRSISNPTLRNGFLLAGLLLTVGGLGCSHKAALPEAKAQAVFVRLGPLVRAHPLYPEVVRLEKLEAEFRVPLPASPQPIQNDVYNLDGLTAGQHSPAIQAAINRRRQTEAQRLVQQAEAGRNTFMEGYRLRRDKLAEQRENEIRGRLVARDAEKEREERERIYQEIIDQLRHAPPGDVPYTTRAAIVRARLAVLSAQLHNPEIPLLVLDKNKEPVFDADAEQIVREEIARLETEGKTAGISKVRGVSERSRLEYRYLYQDGRLLDIKAAINSIRSTGEERLAAVERDASARREKEIAAELARYDNNERIQDRLIRQEGAITEAVDAESRLFASQSASLTPDGLPAANRIQMQSPVWGGPTAPVDTTPAAARLSRQRGIVLQAIASSIRDQVHQFAKARNLDVIVLPEEPSQQDGGRATAGRIDATSVFLQFLSPRYL